MTRLFIPLVLVAAAIGLFVLYTNPTYQEIKALSDQLALRNQVLDKSQQLRTVRDQLLSRRNTFNPSDTKKLQEVLPDNIDNIRLIIDINNIAAGRSLALSGVQLGNISGPSKGGGTPAPAASTPVGSAEVGFSVNSGYDDFLAFLQDLEHSLRIVDIEKISFTAGAAGSSVYTLQIRTYWLH